MQFLFLAAVAFFMLLLGTFDVAWNRAHDISALRINQAQAAAFESFSAAAKVYIAATSWPSGTTAYYWNTMKTLQGMPSGFANMDFPSDWRVVRSPNSWAICATLDEPIVVKSYHVRVSTVSMGRLNRVQIGTSNTADEATINSLCAIY